MAKAKAKAAKVKKPALTDQQIDSLAAEIAADLFTIGETREKAGRLVHAPIGNEGVACRHCGGWGEKPLGNRIAMHLRKTLAR